MDSVYDGNTFSIDRDGRIWEIYRLYGDHRESIHLTTQSMDELRDYFREHYEEDRTA